MTEGALLWGRLTVALALLAVDPAGLKGLCLRARPSPMRDRVVAALPPVMRLHPGVGDDALFGGIDLSATLAGGGLARRRGLLDDPALLLLAMAERCPPGLAARLAMALDGADHALVALDEGAEPDEALPAALVDRLAFQVDLTGLALADSADIGLDADSHARARRLLPQVTVGPDAAADLVRVAQRLGIASLRAPMLALRAARAQAALDGRRVVDADDLTLAVELVFVSRATLIPADPETEDPSPPRPDPADAPDGAPDNEPADQPLDLPQEMLLDAVRALLPPDLLARLAMGTAPRAAGSGAGGTKKGNRRGRPLPSRAGRLDGVGRIDLVATLRTAAPWQGIRRRTALTERLLHIRPADIRLRRTIDTSDRLLIFAVDASGSAAFARLNEAKGAVELLLAQAYARRDHVALVAFRGVAAQVLLPPTRSLVQTRRRLAALPGGGGTPLAAGLQAAMEVAVLARGRGMTPTVVLLTDGRANIALDGRADRAAAAADAATVAGMLRRQGMPALVIDTGARPEPSLRGLAATLAAPYLALPRADAARLSVAVSAALER